MVDPAAEASGRSPCIQGFLTRTFNSAGSRAHAFSGRAASGTPSWWRESTLPERYRNPERIARGGMGEVYRAEDADLARIVAVKLLSDRFADNDAIRGRFTRRRSRSPGSLMRRAPSRSSTSASTRVGPTSSWSTCPAARSRPARAGGRPAHRPLARVARPGRGGARRRARERDRPSRRQAGEPPARRDDRVKVADFGVASAADLGSFTEPERSSAPRATSHPSRPAASARPRRATLRARGRRLRAPDRQRAVRARVLDRGGDRARERGDPPASRSNPRLPPELDDVLARGSRRSRSTASRSAASSSERSGRSTGLPGRPASARSPSAAAARTQAGAAARSLLLGGALLAGVLAATLLAGGDGGETAGTTAPRDRQGDSHAPGHDRRPDRRRPHREPPGPPTTAPRRRRPTPGAGAADDRSPSELNDQGFALMQAGRYEEALPLLEQAVAALAGSGEPAEAYASYNLAFTRLALGQCEGVVELLDRSRPVQGVGRRSAGPARKPKRAAARRLGAVSLAAYCRRSTRGTRRT